MEVSSFMQNVRQASECMGGIIEMYRVYVYKETNQTHGNSREHLDKGGSNYKNY